jgi:hypothetical protein
MYRMQVSLSDSVQPGYITDEIVIQLIAIFFVVV